MCAQNDGVVAAALRLDEIGILHIAGGVTDLEVEQLEVVFVRLHFPRTEDLETHLAEDAVEFPQSLGIGMEPPQGKTPPRQGHVQLFLREGAFECSLFHNL